MFSRPAVSGASVASYFTAGGLLLFVLVIIMIFDFPPLCLLLVELKLAARLSTGVGGCWPGCGCCCCCRCEPALIVTSGAGSNAAALSSSSFLLLSLLA